MPYPFPDDLRRRIDLQLATGMYLDEDELLREAIATLERRQQGLLQLTQMVRESEEDIAFGRVQAFDADKSKELLRQRWLGGQL